MYQDLIRGELSEAADTLAKFLSDDANIQAIQQAAVLLADSFKAGGKSCHAVMADLTVMLCTLLRS